ncbi:aldehyde dehydrogenase family protein [Nocardia bovistercoris]|uniref:Aldehyde dehydrogenase n=1 Tax=Nocardia bovistercoris TaxID=2785916 RepID=A0A931I5P3_9NOCA|nr:aldehyde dehydrogenase family protein [Nocardia bovistercoris]MBH0775332.1 aldehyde dehydrogenase family protein [Nocardia bovistercoris]
MAIVEPLAAAAGERRRWALTSPVDGSALGEWEVATATDVDEALARARRAQPEWAARPVTERAAIIRGAVDVLLARKEEIVEALRAETGKPRAEALTIEILPSCDFLNHWGARAKRQLRDERKRLHGYLLPVKKLTVNYQPLGVVGVITPWNAPFVLSLNPVVQALLAGNTVVLKPSEVTPRSGEWVVRVLREAGVPDDVVQVLHGDGETGAAMVAGDIDKITFTGSVATGRKIAEVCGRRLIPCTLELGGKDAMIVCADADLERAAAGAVYLSMFNTGQVCLSVERIYVVEAVADEFIRKVIEKARAITYGAENKDMGPLFSDRQLEIVRRHVEQAKDKGAVAAVGGAPGAGDGLFFQPTVLVDVDHSMDLMTQETFGPVAAIMRVRDEDEAVRLANDSEYGLSASVFTRDPATVERIGKRLITGSVVHNDAATIYGVAEAPFGGRKSSGVGQVNGVDALRKYTHAQPILIARWATKSEHVWYPYSDKTLETLESILRYAFGNRFVRRLMS